MPEKIEVRFIFSADVAFRAPAYYKPARRRIMNSLPCACHNFSAFASNPK
jgi:hypothetical protein